MNLSDEEAARIVDGLSVAPKRLLMRNNHLDGETTKALARSFVERGRELDVGVNSIGEEAGEALADALGRMLERLRIDSNLIGNAAVSFAAAWPPRAVLWSSWTWLTTVSATAT